MVLHLVVVTGMSGAGKSAALKCLEDAGFFCVDNLPTALISGFAEVCLEPGSGVDKVAMGVDVRGGALFSGLIAALGTLDSKRFFLETLFLDCADDILLRRYKETRRSHPLARRGSIVRAIAAEREALAEIKSRANYIIDTSALLTRELKEQIHEIFFGGCKYDNLIINILTFGYKYGLPADADLVFDVRFIPNPYYIPELAERTGLDADVQSFVLSWGVSALFLEKLKDLLNFLIPNYTAEGKNRLVVAIGCTGGKHRSVTLAEDLYKYLKSGGKAAFIEHRDMRNS
jgi:UPF0042 nucleotide-binding protein